MSTGALEHIRVQEFASAVTGPFTGLLLWDLEAHNDEFLPGKT